jgi:hypothetical protein
MLVLKFILIAVVVLVLLLLVLHLIAPKEAKLERSVLISASKEAIFPYILYFVKRDEWSPWMEMDSNVKTELEGEDGTLNAVWRWEGNNKVGKGHQKNTNIVPNESVDTIVTFEKPWQSQAGSYLRLEEKTDATMVRWGFSTKMSFPFTILGLLMNMDKAVGKDYEKGLNKLKKLVEG